MNSFKLSVIAPMYNEEAGIAAFLREILAVLADNFTNYELLLIDDGSTDQTIQRCLPFIKANPHVRLIAFSRNYGHEVASTAGFDYAEGDYVVLMDSDLQHPPALIPEMVRVAQEKNVDVVCAARKNYERESWLKTVTAKCFYRFSKKMTGFALDEEVGNFRLLNRKVVNSLKQMKESNRHLLMLFAYIGFSTATVSYECPPRMAGRSKYSLKKLLTLSLDSIVSFSARPLHGMAFLSILISLVMMGYAGFILIQKLFTHQQLADGMASIIFLISGL
ncbi:MAG: glycosyltransferase family 2 protein, partial [Methylococcales bacterium]|nr:glycosyltransferase family 2 protein [Methylococcales bacterium]